jgi:uncharacterized membrane protein HdeD (DUF308 family)
LYWVENIVVGIYNFLRILKAKGSDGFTSVVSYQSNSDMSMSLLKPLPTAFFFMIHYGLFTLVHGVFLMIYIFNKSSFFSDRDFLGILAFFVALTISHGFSYFYNYIRNREYEHRSPTKQMFQPYGRIFVIHGTIILGTFIIGAIPDALASNTMVFLFVGLKIVIDLFMHLKAHSFFRSE